MKVLVLNGSPKGERSNTFNVTRAFLDGFPSDTETEAVHLSKLNIKPCMGCYSCWRRTGGKCVIGDDMQDLYGKIKAADIIIESFPLFFFGMPGPMKTFTDRCLSLMLPYLGGNVTDSDICFHKLRDETMLQKKLVVISSCGYVEAQRVYPALLKQLDMISGGRHTAILCPQGEIFIAEDTAKRQREGYLRDVKVAGAEFAENGRLSDETLKRISKPMLSPKGYEALTSAHFGGEDHT